MLQLARAQTLIAALVVLALLVLLLAWRARRASPAVPAWRLGLSQAASAYSLWILVGVSGAAFRYGLHAAWIDIGILAGAALNWFYVGPALRKRLAAAGSARASGVPVWLEVTGTSVPDPALATEGERRGGWQAGVSAGAAGIVLVILFITLIAQLRVAGTLVAQAAGVPIAMAVSVVGALAFLPALIGGRRAAADVATLLALLIVPAAVVLLLPSLLFAAALGSVVDSAPVTFGGRSALAVTLGFLAAGLALPGQPHVLDQFGQASDQRAARNAGVFAIAWFVVLGATMLMLGLTARALYADVGAADQVLVDGAQRLMPSFLQGLPALAIVAAVCSAAGHQLFAAAQAAAPHWLAYTDPQERRRRELRIQLVVAILAVAVSATIDFGSARVFFFAFAALGAVIAPALIANLAGAQWRRGTVAVVVRAGLILTLVLFLAGR